MKLCFTNQGNTILKIKVVQEYLIHPFALSVRQRFDEMSCWQQIPIEGVKIYGFLKEKAS